MSAYAAVNICGNWPSSWSTLAHRLPVFTTPGSTRNLYRFSAARREFHSPQKPRHSACCISSSGPSVSKSYLDATSKTYSYQLLATLAMKMSVRPIRSKIRAVDGSSSQAALQPFTNTLIEIPEPRKPTQLPILASALWSLSRSTLFSVCHVLHAQIGEPSCAL
ncbi:hypothetical protein CKAH01_00403 [Colletotrichum kahawae]|uniref:Uncharacterized protein n=1 Tax=Colletotrichum kahawae TaxID=34407 RepID=A0AAD9YZB7_COLKA|nr:hypothetical protein CKAH01_00403 [Colletotrichum kahawae]